MLLRVYAWIGLLKANGVINNILIWLGVIHDPLTMLYTPFAMYVSIVYSYLPSSSCRCTPTSKKGLAAARGGRGPGVQALAGVLQDHPAPVAQRHPGGLHAGVHSRGGRFVIPALLGGPNALMIGRVLWDEFFSNRAWPVASAVAIVLLILLVPS